PHEAPEQILLSYRFTLSLPVTAALPPGEEKFWRLALEAGRAFRPLDEAEKEALRAKALAARPLFRYPAWSQET
ncbi:MAG TPA: aldo/keto reductase, partial [Candidatus Glassbacteria bacterium]|nr:aldo/keto reductase [Candidatus Glassbacteria bacterium]